MLARFCRLLTGRINIMKLAILPKNILQNHCNYHKICTDNHHRTRKINLKLQVETQKTQIAKTVCSKMTRAGAVTILSLNLYHKALVTKEL